MPIICAFLFIYLSLSLFSLDLLYLVYILQMPTSPQRLGAKKKEKKLLLTEPKNIVLLQLLVLYFLLLLLFSVSLLTPDEDYVSKTFVFWIVLYVWSYRWVHFSAAVVFTHNLKRAANRDLRWMKTEARNWRHCRSTILGKEMFWGLTWTVRFWAQVQCCFHVHRDHKDY